MSDLMRQVPPGTIVKKREVNPGPDPAVTNVIMEWQKVDRKSNHKADQQSKYSEKAGPRESQTSPKATMVPETPASPDSIASSNIEESSVLATPPNSPQIKMEEGEVTETGPLLLLSTVGTPVTMATPPLQDFHLARGLESVPMILDLAVKTCNGIPQAMTAVSPPLNSEIYLSLPDSIATIKTSSKDEDLEETDDHGDQEDITWDHVWEKLDKVAPNLKQETKLWDKLSYHSTHSYPFTHPSTPSSLPDLESISNSDSTSEVISDPESSDDDILVDGTEKSYRELHEAHRRYGSKAHYITPLNPQSLRQVHYNHKPARGRDTWGTTYHYDFIYKDSRDPNPDADEVEFNTMRLLPPDHALATDSHEVKRAVTLQLCRLGTLPYESTKA